MTPPHPPPTPPTPPKKKKKNLSAQILFFWKEMHVNQTWSTSLAHRTSPTTHVAIRNVNFCPFTDPLSVDPSTYAWSFGKYPNWWPRRKLKGYKNNHSWRKLKHYGFVWYVCLKTKNCCLKIFMEIRVSEKVCWNTWNVV